ncbi:hypothetical protein HZU77_011845 [Neisseriaceae bacterium TC5R-5]|nr:hypothetical protein [Neisseriaceae bacterium TC5R-5]
MNAYQQIDNDFLLRFPQGLQDSQWQQLSKKHRSVYKVITLCQQGLTADVMQNAIASQQLAGITETCRQIISRCTTVSTFEKIAFRNYLNYRDVHLPFVQALYQLLHQFDEGNFHHFVEVLQLCQHDKNANPAKWPLVTAFLAYFDPEQHVCVKPTTIKKLAARLKVDIAYQAQPNPLTYQRVQGMVQNFRQYSTLAREENNIIAQAIMYCTL